MWKNYDKRGIAEKIENGVNVVFACGIGSKAQILLKEHNIEVIHGVESKSPADLVHQDLQGKLCSGDNLCNHKHTI